MTNLGKLKKNLENLKIFWTQFYEIFLENCKRTLKKFPRDTRNFEINLRTFGKILKM